MVSHRAVDLVQRVPPFLRIRSEVHQEKVRLVDYLVAQAMCRAADEVLEVHVIVLHATVMDRVRDTALVDVDVFASLDIVRIGSWVHHRHVVKTLRKSVDIVLCAVQHISNTG